jgi:spore germination protein KC
VVQEQGIEEIIDIYLRNLDSRETVKVFIANGEARDFFGYCGVN